MKAQAYRQTFGFTAHGSEARLSTKKRWDCFSKNCDDIFLFIFFIFLLIYLFTHYGSYRENLCRFVMRSIHWKHGLSMYYDTEVGRNYNTWIPEESEEDQVMLFDSAHATNVIVNSWTPRSDKDVNCPYNITHWWEKRWQRWKKLLPWR